MSRYSEDPDTWSYWFKYEAFNFWRIRAAIRRIKRLAAWLPVLWKDEDWDYCYAFRIFQFKLQRMHNDMLRENRHTTANKDCKDIRIAINLLGRLAHEPDFYFDNEERYKSFMGLCSCPAEVMTFEELPIGGRRIHFHTCAWCKSLMKREEKHKKQKADAEFLFAHIAKHYTRWWT